MRVTAKSVEEFQELWALPDRLGLSIANIDHIEKLPLTVDITMHTMRSGSFLPVQIFNEGFSIATKPSTDLNQFIIYPNKTVFNNLFVRIFVPYFVPDTATEVGVKFCGLPQF